MRTKVSIQLVYFIVSRKVEADLESLHEVYPAALCKFNKKQQLLQLIYIAEVSCICENKRILSVWNSVFDCDFQNQICSNMEIFLQFSHSANCTNGKPQQSFLPTLTEFLLAHTNHRTYVYFTGNQIVHYLFNTYFPSFQLVKLDKTVRMASNFDIMLHFYRALIHKYCTCVHHENNNKP